ncbi:MAG: HAMP domain-containing protein [Chloracidobacterium sp.]|nr:HAMP domain-containing protein [Chloracidobacterium sp.]
MNSKERDLRRRKTPWVIGTLMATALVLGGVLQMSNLWKSFSIETANDLILLYALMALNFFALIVFAFIFLRSIIKLVRERRTFALGAKIKTRLLAYFFLVSLLPILAMASFSYLFMNRALDRWFSQLPQQVIQQARNANQPSIDSSLAELDRLNRQQQTIRRVALLTLGVMTFLLIFASSWIAFYVARGLTTPIKALAEGAGEIAAGNLGHRIDVLAEDELAILVDAFNEMSARLEANATELAERRRYIETVLETLPTGVASLDEHGCVTTMNDAARSILAVGGVDTVGRPIADLVDEPAFTVISRLATRARRTGSATEQVTLDLEAERSVSITTSALPGDGGVVLVIEDLSELLAAQRATAWQEVARRMAHEIKNPLTPIQLSAERIAKRFDRSGHVEAGGGKRVNDKGPIADVVNESTATIIREVSSLKAMVDEFSRFARLPETVLQPGDVKGVIRGAVASVEGRFPDVDIRFAENGSLPETRCDAEQIKRVFVNLIDNAAESFDGSTREKRVYITARHDVARDLIVAEVADNGRGIAATDLQKLFQPYFSTKGRGTGLGLAIVKRIITDHHGRIYAAPNEPNGSKFIIELPVD